MTEVIEFLKEFNMQTIISLGVLLYFFSSSIKSDIKSVSDKIDELDKGMKQMNTRVSRVEGTVYKAKVYETIEEKAP